MTWKQGALAALAIALTAHLFLVPFRQGWSQMGTDFPNYYTAAKLTRQGQPLRLFYDWTWFQRQIHYAGIDHQLGGYVPHTPATMLPFIPLSYLTPQTAKRVWLLLELLFVAAGIVMLSRLSGLSLLETLVLALLARAALGNNFVIGQYYLFVLFLLIAGIGCLMRGRDALGGALIGLIFTLKLYTAPFLLLFAVRRQWKALGGFLAAVALVTAITVAIFGPRAIWYFATTVLVRGLDGTVNDPYNPYWASMTAFLRHTLLFEPELNPHPFAQSPALFDFLHVLYTLGVLAVALLVLSRRSQSPAHAFAWFTIVLFVLSPNTASYHYILLLVPVALLLNGATRLWAAGLLVLYVLVELPLYPWDARYFPKVWLLLALAIYVVARCWQAVNPRALLATVAAVVAIAALHHSYLPADGTPAIVTPGSNFSTNPSMTAAGPVYQAMGFGTYVIRGDREFKFEDDVFHPSATRDGQFVYFELCVRGRSQIERLNVTTREAATIVPPEWNATDPAISPDGAKLAFVAGRALHVWEGDRHTQLATGEIASPAFFPDGVRLAYTLGVPGRRQIRLSTGEAVTDDGDCTSPSVSPDGHRLAFACNDQIWVHDLATRASRPLTHAACTNTAPAWDLDGRTIVYATDCRRGLGLTALYRIAAD